MANTLCPLNVKLEAVGDFGGSFDYSVLVEMVINYWT